MKLLDEELRRFKFFPTIRLKKKKYCFFLQIMNNNKKLQYLIPVSGTRGLVLSLAFGLFVALFLWFFEPFGISFKPYSKLEIALFGVISFVVFFLAHTILPLIQPKIYKESNWTIYSQIIFYLILSFVIATFNGIYINIVSELAFSWANYLLIIAQTFALAIIPITLYLLSEVQEDCRTIRFAR